MAIILRCEELAYLHGINKTKGSTAHQVLHAIAMFSCYIAKILHMLGSIQASTPGIAHNVLLAIKVCYIAELDGLAIF